ncbi:DUF6547 family protein [Ruminococcus albus]|uniref:Conserved domain protein n=1 Tax=Ruminococcus albus 8 TaxID=246199 RepID=E9SCW2_RUMAL|nr:DUF6547 family protein [Ruminococcus albus]EGC02867.1 conserved domain protein [Ruminococcus albus 8]MCC3352477.1 hypothetical protein [Ruminococcus albus 8]
MDKAAELYKTLIDELVKISEHSVGADNVRKGRVPAADSEKINRVLAKLSSADREVLAAFVAEEYVSGIFDVLDLLEWYTCCRDMKISVDGEILPTGKFEGMQNDFIGRRGGWKFPDDRPKKQLII